LRRGNYCSPDATTIQGQPDAVTRFVTAFRFTRMILGEAKLREVEFSRTVLGV